MDASGNLYCLQKINGRPLLEYIALYFRKYHICKVIFSISNYKEAFKEYILTNRDTFSFAFDFAESDEYLGSGTAISNALQYSDTPDVLIMQGHHFFDVNLDDLIAWQQTKMGDVTLALSFQESTQSHLCTHLNSDNHTTEFSAGESKKSGLIAGGVYCMFRPSFLNINFPQPFSFKNDYLKKYLKERDFIGMISEGLFVDIRRKEDIKRAEEEFPVFFKEAIDK